MQASNPLVEIKGLVKAFGGRPVLPGLDLVIGPGEFLTLLGPSGCGKTTLLRLLAGFEAPDTGVILLDGRSILPVPPHRRPVNTVFQSYALFPHMSVFDNVAFGLRMRGAPRAQIEAQVGEALGMVKLQGLESRRPHQLSGGQQQRVALARAVVNRPRLLLLDECLNALDSRLRREMQLELKQLQRRLGITFVYVTHDQEEALAMSDRVVVMHDGRIEQVGTPQQIYEEPGNLFVARFVGEANVLDAVVLEGEGGQSLAAEVEGVVFRLRTPRSFRSGERIKVVLRPEDLRLSAWRADAPGPHLRGRVVEQTYKGTTLDTLVRLEGGREVVASAFFDENAASLHRAAGEEVNVGWVEGWEVVLPDV